ncbi:hypothetical protein PF005_g27538 [Phytophthora fragariae]|uniref:Uncharacterized protein n=2 Tax=Phytophthora TaxID=4783 RepID=A0A6A3Q5Q7_9STRA|nr:hypothetical protein PF003_g788 [Phytophthora fragariae]KAE8921377.1 hypothetical protein PF009_g28344 [Phytophthora fragariae]KAE8970506.1 hypothetical protein PF011_g26388 [Phytophthora fragariae]KAE9069441.1 hypothetical protein PF007_g27316 [Phytophthora fragariae]KAE9170486.1 hypothetical protein PF005_g27538 [Phytophthora fragariae]
MQLGASRFMMYTSCCFSTAPKSSASLLGSVARYWQGVMRLQQVAHNPVEACTSAPM